MDGFEATREIMATEPVPIVVISSSVDDEELRITFRAIEEGALAVIEKPRGIGHPDFEAIRRELVTTVRAMAEVKLVRRRRTQPSAEEVSASVSDVPARQAAWSPRRCRVIAVGASTGGPQALRALFSGLPGTLPVPLAVVQHIGHGFIHGLVEWLDALGGPRCRVATQGERLLPGHAYFAPDDHHLRLERSGSDLRAVLSNDPPEDGIRPAVNLLLDSVATQCGAEALGVVLSGMGCDGARGLLAMHEAGAATLVQDEASSVVFGMPGAALARGAAAEALAPETIADRIRQLVGTLPDRVTA
jgi:two-component system chemotaxis response regulator CheB